MLVMRPPTRPMLAAIALGLLLLASMPSAPRGLAVRPPAPAPAALAQALPGPLLFLPAAWRGARIAELPSPRPGLPLTTPMATPSRPVPTETPSPGATASAPPSATPQPSATRPPPATPTAGAADCGALPSFEDGRVPVRELHVAVDGDDAAGDGSAERPFRSPGRAARAAGPGTAIRIHAGTYPGGAFVEGLRGAAEAPIWLGGAPGEARPVFAGGGTALHLVRPRWLVVHDLEIRGASANGLNADDGGAVGDPEAAGGLVFRGLRIHDIGSGGNQDCLKLSGLSDVLVHGSQFWSCGGGGSAVDMVGVHGAIVARSDFTSLGSNAIQVKGGSSDVEIRWNVFLDAGQRAVNMGGSTGFEFFRPPLDPGGENAEARNVRVLGNLFEGGDTPWAFVGCVDCLVAHNTVIEPRIWLMRILQETNTSGGYTFAPARNGRVLNNLFVFRRGQLRSDLNIGGGTQPETFTFAHNLWYAADDPARSAPRLPVAESGAVIGRDPLLRGDFRIPPASPAAGAGLPGGGLSGDFAGRCWADPPAIGAFEAEASVAGLR